VVIRREGGRGETYSGSAAVHNQIFQSVSELSRFRYRTDYSLYQILTITLNQQVGVTLVTRTDSTVLIQNVASTVSYCVGACTKSDYLHTVSYVIEELRVCRSAVLYQFCNHICTAYIMLYALYQL